jgi:arginine decarboxylase
MAASRCWSRLESFGSPFEDAGEDRPSKEAADGSGRFGAFNAPARRPRSMGLRDLSDEMFEHYKRSNQMHHLQQAFSSLPVPEMLPADAYRRLVRNQVERVPLDDAANRVVATSVVPYPPGIPMMMPGENTGPADGPYLGYLKALRDWDGRFAGFGHETHGVEVKRGSSIFIV